MRNSKLQLMTKIGILSAIAFIVMFFEFPIPFFPPYLKIDLSDIPAIIGAFAFGPVAGVTVELIKNLLHFIARTDTGGVGELANFLTGGSFVLIAGLIYSRNKTKANALIALIAGVFAMALVMSFANYYILIPVYAPTMPKPEVLKLIYSAIFPFNLFKGVVVSAITLLIYKSLSPILHR